jgi:hypothetical protein
MDHRKFVLKAATSLARHWQFQGKTREARGLLAQVYGWFTEGFDTRPAWSTPRPSFTNSRPPRRAFARLL